MREAAPQRNARGRSQLTAPPALSPSNETPTIELLGVRVHAITEAECVAHIVNGLRADRGGWVVTPNLDHLRRLHDDATFRSLCSRASLLVPDGAPLVWASRLQGTPLPSRVAGSDLIVSLTSRAAEEGFSVYFLGGEPGTADAAAEVLRERFPGLRVAGTLCPDHGFEKDEDRLGEVRDRLCEARPDVVYVGLGSPKQEQVIDRFRDDLPSSWWLGVGISFSFLSGHVRRAPRWMQRAGLEWSHRLIQEPRRLARRYLVYGIPFAGKLLVSSALRGLRKN